MRNAGMILAVAIAFTTGVPAMAGANMEDADNLAERVYGLCSSYTLSPDRPVIITVPEDGSAVELMQSDTARRTPIVVNYGTGMTFNDFPVGDIVEGGAFDCTDAANQVRAAWVLNGEMSTPDFDIRSGDRLVNQGEEERILYVRLPGKAPVYKTDVLSKGARKPFGLKLRGGFGSVFLERNFDTESEALLTASAYEYLRVHGVPLWTPPGSTDRMTMLAN
jgi:hypothetical protein